MAANSARFLEALNTPESAAFIAAGSAGPLPDRDPKRILRVAFRREWGVAYLHFMQTTRPCGHEMFDTVFPFEHHLYSYISACVFQNADGTLDDDLRKDLVDSTLVDKLLGGREWFEMDLRLLSSQTGKKYEHLNPPPVSSPSGRRQPIRPPARDDGSDLGDDDHNDDEKEDKEQRADGGGDDDDDDEEEQRADDGGDHGADGDGAGDQDGGDGDDERAENARRLQGELDANMAALRRLGLPPLGSAAGSPAPPWVGRLRVRIRIVDFYAGGCATSRMFVAYLRALGCEVAFTTDRDQIGVSCGWVAARACVSLWLSHDWWSCDVSDSADQHWITVGDAILGLEGSHSRFIGNDQVVALANAWWTTEAVHEPEAAGPPCDRCGEEHLSAECPHRSTRRDASVLAHSDLRDRRGWLSNVTACDYSLRQLMDQLYAAACTGTPVPFRAFVVNDQDSRCLWFR